MVKVKICGITNTDDALRACALGTDAIGFIFVKSSPRYISPVQASGIIAKLPPFVSSVGVFVNEQTGFIRKIVTDTGLSAVQLHGDEKPHQYKELVIPVIKAFRVQKEFDIAGMKAFTCAVTAGCVI